MVSLKFMFSCKQHLFIFIGHQTVNFPILGEPGTKIKVQFDLDQLGDERRERAQTQFKFKFKLGPYICMHATPCELRPWTVGRGHFSHVSFLNQRGDLAFYPPSRYADTHNLTALKKGCGMRRHCQ